MSKRRSVLILGAIPLFAAFILILWYQSTRSEHKERVWTYHKDSPFEIKNAERNMQETLEIFGVSDNLTKHEEGKIPEDTITKTAPNNDNYENNRIRFPPPNELVEKALSLPQGSVSAILSPVMGAHRPRSDAVFAVAYGAMYGQTILQAFIGSLNVTGFEGDVVLLLKASVLQDKALTSFLSTYMNKEHGVNLVIYAPEWLIIQNAQKLQADELWSYKNSSGHVTFAKDPRRMRPIATLRFELYWLWLQRYEKGTRFLLTDFKDVVFQRNPFAHYGEGLRQGYLDFFEELADPQGVNGFANERWDRDWIANCFGKQVRIADRFE
jgi:hypothetical protein